ncbi:MAG TPA: YfhO family protein [Thermoanaerobaculia bacterium]
MNPALPLLALLSLAGLLLRRREIGIPWAACGLVGMALLWPALRLPDGIPSPAASLAAEAPWQGIADPVAGNPNLRDITLQVQPWLLFLRHELRAGRLPFWDPHQFSGSPYWSNGSGAPLFPLHLLFAALPLQLGWILLPWLRIVIGGCGAWSLARELGASRPAALLAALIFPLSGMITSFLLFPMGNTHALVPWVLLAVERLASGRGTWLGLAVAGGFQMLGGHPETPVFTALLAGVYLLARGSARPLVAWGRFVAGWGVAAAISAVQLLPLYRTLTGSGKWLHAAAAPAAPLGSVTAVLLRLILPDLFGNPAQGTWWGPFNFAATAVYAGALTIPLAAAGLAAARGDRRWRAVAAMTLFALVAAYQLFGMRAVLLALPAINRGLHHYMKFGVELGLALLAAAGCDRWLAGRGRGLLAGAGVTLGLLAVAWWRFGAGFRAHGLLGVEAGWTAAIAILAVLLALSLLLPAERRWAVWPLLPALLAVDLTAAHARTNPGLSNARLYPVTGAVRFLQGRPERVAGLGDALHPDAAMVYGLYDVRGDSPVKLQRYEEIYGEMGTADPVYFFPIRDWTSPWLDRLGVRWVVAGPAEDAPSGLGWKLAYAGRDARVYERPGASPLARLEVGGQARVETRVPGRWRISWRAPVRTRLVVAETWDPGWRATAGGRPVAIEPLQGILMTVPVGPGSGSVELRYHPDGFVPGLALSALGLCLVTAGGARRWAGARRGRPESRQD